MAKKEDEKMIDWLRPYPESKEWIPTGQRYLIIGYTGLIGSSIFQAISNNPFDYVAGVSRGKIADAYGYQAGSHKFNLDVNDEIGFTNLLKNTRPTVILDFGGAVDVDECQKYPIYGPKLYQNPIYTANVERVRKVTMGIWKYCKEINLETPPVLIEGSTDFVYGNNGPHSEKDIRRIVENSQKEINVYALTKVLAEQELESQAREYKIPYLILRFAFPYNQRYRRKTGTAVSMFENLASGNPVIAVSDYKMTITPTDYIPSAINRLVTLKAWEEKCPIFNIAGPTIYTGLDIARICARELKRREIPVNEEKQIQKSTVEEFFKGKAPRPIQGGVLTDKIKNLGIKIPAFEEVVTTFKWPYH